MARVYADVNANMPRSYWDYDSVAISWGVLENYEIVRKIGRFNGQRNGRTGYVLTKMDRAGQILGSFRRHQRRQLPEMCHQSPQTCQEEKDQT